MRRIDALGVISELGADLPVVATCAATSRELAAVADRPNHLYLLDSMGLTTSVGTGLALACAGSPVSHVITVDGDGSLLMNLGALATAGFLAPAPLLVVLLDNGVYASTGNIPTQAARIDLGAVAAACGLNVAAAGTPEELRAGLSAMLGAPGPHLLHVRIEPGNEPGTPLLLDDPVVLGDRFRTWLTARLEGAAR
ncbi:MAG TPA: thiamine pyrophosphate-dependent enzyme [Streptosporangiaceae bacterium]